MDFQLDKTPRDKHNVVVRETGIKPGTLRAWERRYGLPLPQHSARGHRLYSQDDRELALSIEEHKTPLAFGGRIFNQQPELPRRIPGHFLGEEIPAAIPKIENILRGPSFPLDRKGVADEFKRLVSQFIEAKPAIDSQIHNWARGEYDQEAIRDAIALANDQLDRDIISALTLGDINLR